MLINIIPVQALIPSTPTPTPIPPTCTTTIPAADVPALISAITAANSAGSPQTICLEEGTYALTAVQHNADGPNGLPAISGDVTLLGLGSGAVIQRDSSAPKFRILRVTSTGRLVLEKITIRGGDPGGSHNGGGIRNLGTLELKNGIVEENVARDGGGLFVSTANTRVLLNGVQIVRNGASNAGAASLE